MTAMATNQSLVGDGTGERWLAPPPTHKHRRLPLGATLPADVGPHPDARAPGVGNQRNTSGGETTWDGATEDSVTSEWLVERASSGGEDKDVDGGRPT